MSSALSFPAIMNGPQFLCLQMCTNFLRFQNRNRENTVAGKRLRADQLFNFFHVAFLQFLSLKV